MDTIRRSEKVTLRKPRKRFAHQQRLVFAKIGKRMAPILKKINWGKMMEEKSKTKPFLTCQSYKNEQCPQILRFESDRICLIPT